MTHRLRLRWLDPGANTIVEASCSCGEWSYEFRPESKLGQPLPLDIAAEEFLEHRLAHPEEPVL